MNECIMRYKQNPIIVGIGEILWDMLPTGKKAGGAPVNFIYHASLLGVESYAVSAVGNDERGDELVNLVEHIGINHRIARVDYPTGTVAVGLNHGVPTYTITEKVAWDYIPFTHSMHEIARKTDAVCFGTLAQRSSTSKTTIQKFLSFIPKDSFRVLDINLRAPFYSPEIIKESFQFCNILKLNIEELEVVRSLYPIEGMSISDAGRWLMATYNLKYLILTAGADFSMVLSPETISYLETPKVDVVDTVGAGDSFTAAFITSLLKGATMEEAHNKAIERAAAVCTVAGAWTNHT